MQQEKPALREEARKKRAELELPLLSDLLIKQVRTLPEFKAARHVLLYLAMPGEIALEGLCDNEKQWYVPRCAPKRRLAVHPYTPHRTPLRAGPFGIREPDADVVPEIKPELLNLVLVPSLLLTKAGDRLGYGGGYYDRFLPRLRAGCVTVGTLPEALMAPSLPTDPWDVSLQVIVTEEGIYREH